MGNHVAGYSEKIPLERRLPEPTAQRGAFSPSGISGLMVRDPDVEISRKRALLATLPFLLLGLADLVLLLLWGIDPLWGFMILPPILFMSILAWIAFRSGFVRDRTGGADPDVEVERP